MREQERGKEEEEREDERLGTYRARARACGEVTEKD